MRFTWRLLACLWLGIIAATAWPVLAQITINGVNALGAVTAASVNGIGLVGTAGTTMTFPTTTATLARTDAANTFTGVQTMTSAALTTPTVTTLLTAGSGIAVANVGANSCGTSAATIVGQVANTDLE